MKDNKLEVKGGDLHEIEIEIRNQAVRGLFLINGGGAVALLAFLGGIWGKDIEMARYVANGIAILALGSAITAAINFVRSFTSQCLRLGQIEQHKTSQALQYIAVALAFSCFIGGVGGWFLVCTHIVNTLQIRTLSFSI